MEKDSDVLHRYRAVTNKLKKRFLKKPNVSEGSEQFASLSKQLKNQECDSYAGFCSLAQARCENSLVNPSGEAQALLDAARSFLSAEMEDRMLNMPGFKENLIAAVNCYSHAIRVHMENKQLPLAASLCLEVGTALRKMKRSGEAIVHFQRAADLQSQSPLNCLDAMRFVAKCKIDTRDYDGALSVLTEMAYLAHERGGSPATGHPLGAYCDILAKCEVNRVLLLLLLQPTPQRIRPEHAQTLEKYTWETCDTVTELFLGEDLYLLLQSVVMASQSHDLDSIRLLQKDLWSYLDSEQNQLLHLVIQEMTRPSGEGL